MWSGAVRSTPINDKTDRKKPSAWRKGTRKTRRSVNAVSIAQSENVFGAPGRPDGAGRHASVASAESHSVTSPRWTKACSYADQFPTRYFVVYFGWTFDLMSRSCTRSGHRGQRADSCLVAAEGLCTNARCQCERQPHGTSLSREAWNRPTPAPPTRPPRGACVAVTPNLVWIAQVGDCVQVLYDRGRSCARGGGRGDGSWYATKGTRAPHGRLRVRSGNVHVIVAAIGYRM